MNRKEIIQSINKIEELFIDVINIIKNQNIERGYSIEFNTKQGVLIEDTIAGEYNFYKYEHYIILRDLATEIYKFMKKISNIKNRNLHTLCIYYCYNVINVIDRLLRDKLLFPILSYLLGKTSNKNKYIIEIN